MRKFAVSLAILLLLAMTIMPTFAQDDGLLTIAQLIIEEANADQDAEFTTLMAAIIAADPSFLEMISSPDSRVTVFAPTDAAFDDFIEALGTTRGNLLSDRFLLNNILSYHIVPALLPEESLAAMDGGFVGTILPGEALSISSSDDNLMVNRSNIIESNLFARNGVVHVIDTVLATPPHVNLQNASGSIASIIATNSTAPHPEFTVLRAAIENAGPGVFASLAGKVPYTLFAPTDAAFEAALEQLGLETEDLLADHELLNTILSYHVVPGRMTLNDLLFAGSTVESTGSYKLATLLPSITLDVTLDNGKFMATYANVIRADIPATNGVIHVIDAVLIPPQ